MHLLILRPAFLAYLSVDFEVAVFHKLVASACKEFGVVAFCFVKFSLSVHVGSNGEAIARALTVTLQPSTAPPPGTHVAAGGRSAPAARGQDGPLLDLAVILEPLRPLRGNVQVILTHPSGGALHLWVGM